MADALDTELIGLLNRLTKVQKEVGGGKKEKSLAEQLGTKLDRFVDLYDRMNERLQVIKNSIDEIRKLEKMPGSNPRDLITHQGKVGAYSVISALPSRTNENCHVGSYGVSSIIRGVERA